MSKFLSAAAVTLFDAEVKQAYQAAGFTLRGTTRSRMGVVGSTVRFPKMSAGLAKLRNAPQSDVVPMNIAHTNVSATLTDWDASEYTDIFDQATVNYSERAELATIIAYGLGRRADQIIIDALAATAGTSTAIDGAAVGGATPSNLSVVLLRRAAMLLDKANVPSNGRHYVGHASQKEALLGRTPAISADFNTVKALVQGEINTFLGFQFHWIGDRDEGGLTLAAGNIRQTFAYHESAVGFAEGIAATTEVNYIPQKKSWLSSGHMKAGAIAIDTQGVIIVSCDEDEAVVGTGAPNQ